MRVYGGFEVVWAVCLGVVLWLGVIIALATAAALGAGNLMGVMRGLALLTLCALLSGFAHARLSADRHRRP